MRFKTYLPPKKFAKQKAPAYFVGNCYQDQPYVDENTDARLEKNQKTGVVTCPDLIET